MAEWSIAAVLKTVEGNTSGGSNPSLSAGKPDFSGFCCIYAQLCPETDKVGCVVMDHTDRNRAVCKEWISGFFRWEEDES